MKKVKQFYELSQKADNDIEKIFDYTLNEYGIKKAIEYITEFHEIYNYLLTDPKIGRHRIEIKKDFYSVAKNKHIIFYRIFINKIRIVRVLHGSRDLPKYF
ncbi:MAG: type II toxin-antitoxin system RelE/ParE family toxin [Flavobacteriaceae bacterium]